MCLRIRFFPGILLFAFIAAISFAGGAAANGEGRDTWPPHLRFLSGPNGGQWYFIGESIADLLSDNMIPTSSRIGGGLSNIEKLDKKNGDLAFTLNSLMGAHTTSDKDTVLLANIYPQVLYVAIHKDFADRHGIDSMEKLLSLETPLRLASLKPGTASEAALSTLLKHGYDTDFDRLKEQGWDISFCNYANITDSFVAGNLECFAYTAGTNVPLIHAIEEHTDIVILPIEPEILDRLAEKFKTRLHVIPPGVYKSVQSPLPTLGDFTCIAVRRSLPDDLVYEITKIIWEGKDSIAKSIADFGSLSPDTAVSENLPMHPGSLKFWSELGSEIGREKKPK